jgi:TonB-linked SusC/RagA family outer membrane protein
MTRKLLSLCFAFLLVPTFALAQNGTLSGRITDGQTNEALPGANVYLVELGKGASTNIDGEYRITNITPGTYTLTSSYVGYKKYETQIEIESGENTLDIELTPDLLGLEEVVVTGYGAEVEKGNLTSSITKVGADDIETVNTSNPSSMLQGKAAGVQVVQNSGTPGGGLFIRVRGSTSINATNEPLYVIDGIPVDNSSNAYIGVGNQGLGGLSNLNPNDIESIEILKDASATAIYGARGANGVVLITTKKGSAAETKLDFSYAHGVKEFPNQQDMLGAEGFIKTYVDGLYGDFFGYYDAQGNSTWGTYNDRYTAMSNFLAGFGLTFGSYAGLSEIDDYGADPAAAPSTDWQDAVFETGVTDEFSLSAQGGDVKTRYYLSGNYYNENGIMRNSGFERLAGRLNLDHSINDRATINARVSYSRSVSERIENDNNIYGVLTNAILSNPTRPIYNDDGTFNPNIGFAFSNAVAASEVKNDALRTRFIGNVDLNYDITDYITVTGTFGLDRYDLKEDQFAPSFTNQGSPLGNAVASVGFNQTWVTQYRINYNQNFDEHDVNAVGVVEFQETKFERTFSTGEQFPSDELRTINSAANTTGGSFASTNGLESYTARINYAYDSRYLLTVTGRVDGSSRFSEDNKYGFFPSASIAWRITNESFMDNVDLFDNLKLRVSAGITGNQGIGNFSALGLFGVVSYSGLPALAPTQLANPDLKWEQTTQYNIGVDMDLLDERISFSADAYLKDTKDLLLNRPVPATSGFTSYTSNIGSMENKGLEFTLSTVNIRTQDFRWRSDLNISINRNKVKELYQGQPFSSGFASRVQEGQPLGAFYGYITDGIWNTQQEIDDYVAAVQSEFPSLTAGDIVGAAIPGDVRFKDVNGDGVFNAEDQKIMGSAEPDFQGGFTNTLNYKGFELRAFLQFSVGNDIYNNNRGFTEHFGYAYNHTTKALDAWTPDNTDTDVYRSSWFDSNQNTRDSDLFIENGSYLRLKNLTLSYNLPVDLIDRIGLRSLRVYATGQNVFTITDYSGLDPEINTFDGSNTALGTDFFVYPQARSFVFGVNIGL